MFLTRSPKLLECDLPSLWDKILLAPGTKSCKLQTFQTRTKSSKLLRLSLVSCWDKTLHMSWTISCKRLGQRLLCFWGTVFYVSGAFGMKSFEILGRRRRLPNFVSNAFQASVKNPSMGRSLSSFWDGSHASLPVKSFVLLGWRLAIYWVEAFRASRINSSKLLGRILPHFWDESLWGLWDEDFQVFNMIKPSGQGFLTCYDEVFQANA